MPNKTIYVADDDLPLYQRAQELAGGSLSSAISKALRRYIEAEEGRREGYDEITVRVGYGKGRKQRFTGVLLGEWGQTVGHRVEVYRVYRSRKGKFVVHVKRSTDVVSGTSSGLRSNGWRGFLEMIGSDQSWGVFEGEATLHVAETLDDLRALIPIELYERVATVADQPAVEDLDI